MTQRALQPCAEVGCRRLVRGARCAEHERPKYKQVDNRGSASSRGYGARWRRLRGAFLAAHPICNECVKHKRITPAVDVHHRVARRKSPELAYSWDNLEALCHGCHSQKTRKGE